MKCSKTTNAPVRDFLSNLIKCQQQLCLGSPLDPVYTFVVFLEDCLCSDMTVLIDLLVSGRDTSVLEYLLKVSKFVLQENSRTQTNTLLLASERYDVALQTSAVSSSGGLHTDSCATNPSDSSLVTGIIWVVSETRVQFAEPAENQRRGLDGEEEPKGDIACDGPSETPGS
eukprot:gene31500-40561_t